MQRTYQLPPAELHTPQAVSEFVHASLTADEQPHQITHQQVGVLACQHPQTLDRFLRDAADLRDRSTAESSLYVIDDSWDGAAAAQIAETSQQYGASYYRLRTPNGLAEQITQHYADTLPTTLSDSERQYHIWLARAATSDRLGMSTADAQTTPRGGYGGARNFGYLAGIYRAGQRGDNLTKTLITVNDDDMRYRTLGEAPNGMPRLEDHDFFAERAAWYTDPRTSVVVERYAGHRGNPIAITQDAIGVCEQIIAAQLSGDTSRKFAVFNQETEVFEQLPTTEAFAALPRIVQSISERRPQVALATHNSYSAQPTPNWEQAKINFGAITLRGDVAAHIPVPAAGIYDFNFGALLRGHAGRRPEPNRVIRVGQAMVHQRECRTSGGDAVGPTLVGAIDNNHNREQAIIAHVVAHDEAVQQGVQKTFDIPTELFRVAATNQDNTGRIKSMQATMQRIQGYAAELREKSYAPAILNAVERLADGLPIAELEQVQTTLEYIPTERERHIARRGIFRYLRLFDAWEGISHAAYDLGRKQRSMA